MRWKISVTDGDGLGIRVPEFNDFLIFKKYRVFKNKIDSFRYSLQILSRAHKNQVLGL